MENYIIKLYKKYLYGTIKSDEFQELRYEINNTKYSQLNELLENEWNENMTFENLAENDKEEIRTNIDFYIECDKKHIFRKKLMRVAAIIIPFVFIATTLLYNYKPALVQSDFVVVVKPGNRAMVILPDQSKVWMNSNSKLTYSIGIKNTREVKLIGEAFFKVFKDKSHPFIVSANNLQIEVLGTSFNVKARQGSDLIETSLIEGSVKLCGADLSQDYYLKPNEKAIYSNILKNIKIESTDNEDETAWKNNNLTFNSERFVDVIAKLDDWYGVKIISRCPSINNDKITGSFKGESLETVLKTLKIQYHIQYKNHGDTIILSNN